MGNTLPTVDLGTGRTATAISIGGVHTCVILDNAMRSSAGGTTASASSGSATPTLRGDGPGEMGDSAPRRQPRHRAHRHRHHHRRLSHTCALLDDRTVKCWGDNIDGQLGARRHRPTEVTAPARWATPSPRSNLGTATATAISVGGAASNHTCAVLDNHTVKCWGEPSSSGQIGYGPLGSLGNAAGARWATLCRTVDLGIGRARHRGVTAGDVHLLCRPRRRLP